MALGAMILVGVFHLVTIENPTPQDETYTLLTMWVFSIFLIGTLFRFAEKLKSPGTVFRIEEAVGKEAVVYHRIPQMGSGKITLSLHNFSYEIDAVSEHSKEIPSFARVQVVKKLDDKTVLVRGL